MMLGSQEVMALIMCSACKKNIAVVFITKIINGKQTQEGLCLSCARKQGIKPINQLIEQSGMTEDDIDNLNDQVTDLLENMDMDNLTSDMSGENSNDTKNFLFNFFNKTFPKEIDSANSPSGKKRSGKYEEKDSQNNTRTKIKDRRNNRKKKFLDAYGENLIDKAKDGNIDRVIGRGKEIERVIQILNRRTKNNPVLIGEPGVGKTAIAEGLALKILNKDVPVKLLNQEVYLLDLTLVVAGTQFRGQFEARMKGIIEEVKALGNIILVIDELHSAVGAGDAEGAVNAANILKPSLSKGEIQVVGATTLNEYRKHIEKDQALERRFQPVIVNEPTIEESIEILKGIKGYYEDYHNVKIPNDVVEASVYLSERYITDRYLPDKAIDVIDEAGSRVNLKNEALIELEILKEELKKVQEEKEDAVSADSIEDYQKAADLKVRECKLIENIKAMEKECHDIKITVDDVAYIVEAWSGVPVQKLTGIETEKLLNLEEKLKSKIIGQDEAVNSLSKAIRRHRIGFGKKKSPGSYVFIGPTGVGKTELVKVLAVELFGSEDTLIRLDMSEYMEKHSVSKLIGSPPGYVGYDDGGQLTEKIRRKPYSIILLDEIEKAHPDVFNMLLQILEDGRLTDSQGRTVSFENALVVMTSNAGTTLKSGGIGFNTDQYSKMEDNAKSALKEIFRPEFLNRLDEIIVFKELGKEELRKIIDLMLKEVEENVYDKGIIIELTDLAKEFLLKKGYDIKFGARPLRRTIQKFVEDELSELYLKGIIKKDDKVLIDFKEDGLIFKKIEMS
jgi:ATP-dependent Clp protease ATP-binding subunit ClpA